MTREELTFRTKRLLAGIAQSGVGSDGATVVVWPKTEGKTTFDICRWEEPTRTWVTVGESEDAETALLLGERIVQAGTTSTSLC